MVSFDLCKWPNLQNKAWLLLVYPFLFIIIFLMLLLLYCIVTTFGVHTATSPMMARNISSLWCMIAQDSPGIFCLVTTQKLPQPLSNFLHWSKPSFGSRSKCLRFDNAKKGTGPYWFLQDQTWGRDQFSCVEMKGQGKTLFVERKHQHLLNVAQVLYFRSKVPITLWGECTATAAFLINRFSLSNFQGKCLLIKFGMVRILITASWDPLVAWHMSAYVTSNS